MSTAFLGVGVAAVLLGWSSAAGVAFPGTRDPEPGTRQEILLDRTLAIVYGEVITLADARAAMALGLVESGGSDELRRSADRLIERALVLREVERFTPTEPALEAVEARLGVVQARAGTPADLAALLAQSGLTEARLRAWIRNDLRIQSYLDQRFAAAGVPSEQEVQAYYAEHRAEFDKGGVPFAEAVPLVRERLAAERRSELIDDWIGDLRRRAQVIDLLGGS
jgi:hypothetical protein